MGIYSCLGVNALGLEKSNVKTWFLHLNWSCDPEEDVYPFCSASCYANSNSSNLSGCLCIINLKTVSLVVIFMRLSPSYSWMFECCCFFWPTPAPAAIFTTLTISPLNYFMSSWDKSCVKRFTCVMEFLMGRFGKRWLSSVYFTPNSVQSQLSCVLWYHISWCWSLSWSKGENDAEYNCCPENCQCVLCFCT